MDSLIEMNMRCGTIPYDGYPTLAQYRALFTPERIASDRTIYYGHLPVTASGNVYFGGAEAADCETAPVFVDAPIALDIV